MTLIVIARGERLADAQLEVGVVVPVALSVGVDAVISVDREIQTGLGQLAVEGNALADVGFKIASRNADGMRALPIGEIAVNLSILILLQ